MGHDSPTLDIVLRPLTVSDVTQRYVNWLNNPAINKYLELRHSTPVTHADVCRFVDACTAQRRHHWGIFLTPAHQHVGLVSCSVHNQRYRWADVSIVVGQHQGHGIGKRAVAAAVNHLFKADNLHRVQAGTYAVHKASMRLFAALGFRQEARFKEAVLLDQHYVDEIKFGVLQREWRYPYPEVPVLPMAWEETACG